MILYSFLTSLFLCPALIFLSGKLKIYDVPDKRKLHKKPTSKLGGISIVISYFLYTFLNNTFNQIFFISFSLLFFLIILDDIFSLNRYFRLFVQILSSLILILGNLNSGYLPIILVLFICITFINLFNFFDGLNTLLGSQFCFILLTYLLLDSKIFDLNLIHEEILISVFSTLGFLIFNAFGLIFMGDIGSCFTGLLISNIFIENILNFSFEKLLLIFTPLLPLLVDTSLTILIRLKNGEKFFSTPHNQHAYQLLSKMKFKHIQISFIYLIKLLIYSSSLILLKFLNIDNFFILLILSIYVILDIFLILFIRRKASSLNLII